MAEPATEGDRIFDSKRTCELFEALAFRTVPNHREARQIIPQKVSGPAQSQIACLPRYETTDEYQLESGAWFGPA
jgi:hypothetical protein